MPDHIMNAPTLFAGILVSIFLLACNTIFAADAPAIVPLPEEIKPNPQTFELTAQTKVTYIEDSLKPVAEYLAAHLRRATGFEVSVAQGNVSPGEFQLTLRNDPELGDEGYLLEVAAKGAKLSAQKPAGVFNAIQTFRQLLPAQIESNTKVDNVKWIAPGVTIRDWPRFAYRGFMLDSCRHMQSLDYIKRTLDLMAMYKLNRFHWHLSEDQGWRIEIKKYPKLTEIGAWRDETMGDGKRYGGFYTQDQIREIVKYAADRYITVIPEIDMPGHMMGALASYPNLGCTGGPYKVRTQWGIEKDVLCAGNPEVYDFVKGVLDEVCELFPSDVIHIGGDECPRDRWKDCPKCQAKIKAEGLKDEDALQNYFTHYVAKYLESKGRRLQGWNEIMKGGDLPQSSIVHVWNNDKDTTTAAKSGRDVVYSRTSFMYFDYPWERVPMAKVYATEPVPSDLSADEAKHILGLQANLWTEHKPTDISCDEFTWPRLAAMAEVGWTDKSKRDYTDFLSRMTRDQYQRQAQTKLGASQEKSVEQIAKELAERGAIQEKKQEKKG
jgi:hexosaminidase